jgi:hypothetical protein
MTLAIPDLYPWAAPRVCGPAPTAGSSSLLLLLGCSNSRVYGSPMRVDRKPRCSCTVSRKCPFGDKDYRYLVAANIGAVIMPWVNFYQQSAVADNKLRTAEYRSARDTGLGAVATQMVIAAALVAACRYHRQDGGRLRAATRPRMQCRRLEVVRPARRRRRNRGSERDPGRARRAPRRAEKPSQKQ